MRYMTFVSWPEGREVQNGSGPKGRNLCIRVCMYACLVEMSDATLS